MRQARGSSSVESGRTSRGSSATSRQSLPKLSSNPYQTPLVSQPSSHNGSTRASMSKPTRPGGVSATSSRPSRGEGSAKLSPLQRRAQAEDLIAKREFQMLAVEIEETERLLANNLEKQNMIVARRWQRKVAALESESEPSLEAWLWNGGRWAPGTPLPAPRWPSLSPTQKLPDLSTRGGSSASQATPQRSQSMGSLPTSPPGSAAAVERESSAKSQELLDWMKGKMDPQQQPAALYHRPLAPLALSDKAIREVRSRQRWSRGGSQEDSLDIPYDDGGGEAMSRADTFGFGDQVWDADAASDKSRPSPKDSPGRQAADEPATSSTDGRSDPLSQARKRRLSEDKWRSGSMSLVDYSLDESPSKSRGLGVNRQKALQAFKRLGPHGDIASTDLVQVLNYTGHTNVESATVMKIVDDKFNGRSHLDREDFLEFIGYYEEEFRTYIEDLFTKADTNDSGSLGAAEISAMLRRLGITPTPGVVEELILEVTGVDHGLTEVTLEQFVQIHDIVRDRAGFTGSEVTQMKAIFSRYDRDKSGSIDGQELRAALSWWGFAVQSEVTEGFISEFVFDDSDNSDFHAFLQIMRKHREVELEKMHNAFSRADADHGGTLDEKELPAVFSRLGYTTASPAVIKECFTDCGLDADVPLIFEDLYLLIEEFRHTEGFQKHELQEIDEVFKQHAEDDGGSIGGISLASAIRWLGYPQTFEQVQEIFETFNIDDGGRLDFSEFLKMMRRYRELEVETIHSLFQEDEGKDTGPLSVSILRKVILGVGHAPASGQVQELWEKTGSKTSVTFWELDEIVSQFRIEARERFRSNHGFADREVTKLRIKFNRFDKDRNGYIENKDLAKLLSELFPDAEYSLESHGRAREMLRSVDENGDGMLEFKEFLALMRIIQDKADADALRKEQETVKKCTFKREEVAEFRKVFQMFDMDASGEMSFSEFAEMIGNVVPIEGHKYGQELRKLLADVDEEGDRQLGFPEFLIAMQKIQDQNWHGINDAKPA